MLHVVFHSDVYLLCIVFRSVVCILYIIFHSNVHLLWVVCHNVVSLLCIVFHSVAYLLFSIPQCCTLYIAFHSVILWLCIMFHSVVYNFHLSICYLIITVLHVLYFVKYRRSKQNLLLLLCIENEKNNHYHTSNGKFKTKFIF